MSKISFLSILSICCSLNNVVTAANSQDVRLQALASLSLEELMQIRIETAGKIAEKIGEIPASVVLVTREDIKTYGYTKLDEILEHVSGIYKLNSYALGGSAFGVRGYLSTGAPNRNIMILINGISKLLDSDSTFIVSNSPMPVEAIDRIEIIRGPQSTIYGNGAFFGVINIVTNEIKQQEETTSYISTSIGSNQKSRLFGRTGYLYDKGKVVLNAGSYREYGFDVPYERLESFTMAGEQGLSTGGRLEKKEKYFDLSATYNDFSLNIMHELIDEEGFASAPTIRSGTRRETESTHVRLAHKAALSKELSLTSKYTYIYDKTFVNFDSPFINHVYGYENDSSIAHEGEITLQWHKPQVFDWINGVYYRRAPNISAFIDLPVLPTAFTLHKSLRGLEPNEAVVTKALFSQINYYPSQQWKWVAGLRLEQISGYTAASEYGTGSNYQRFIPHYDAQKLAVIPRLATIYSYDDKNTFKWMYGKAINLPSFAQNTASRLTPDYPPLLAEQIETYEFNYITYFSPRYMLSTNLFHNRLNNLFGRTDMVLPNGGYTTMFGNGGKWITNGIELSLHAQPTNQMKLELSATYQKTKDVNFSTVEMSYSPRLLGQLKLSYQFDKHLSLGLTGFYVSKMETFFDTTERNIDGSLGKRIDGSPSNNYFTAGANLHYQDWVTKGTFLNLRATNLFNENITYPTFTRNLWIDKGTTGEKRQFMLTLGYQF